MNLKACASLGRQALAYGAAGLVNTALGGGVIVGLTTFTGVGPVISNAAGVGAGLLASFLMHRRIFKAERSAMEAARWGLAVLIALAIDFTVLRLSLAVLAGQAFAPLASQGAALATYSLCLFLLSRFWVFRTSPLPPAPRGGPKVASGPAAQALEMHAIEHHRKAGLAGQLNIRTKPTPGP